MPVKRANVQGRQNARLTNGCSALSYVFSQSKLVAASASSHKTGDAALHLCLTVGN
jgi:hypothetical protein